MTPVEGSWSKVTEGGVDGSGSDVARGEGKPPAHHKHGFGENQCKVSSSRFFGVIMRRFWKDALLYLLASGLSGAVIGVASFWLLRTSYAGVSDEGVVRAGVSAFQPYLRSLGWAILALNVLEVVVLAVLSSGLVAIPVLADRPRRLLTFVGIACSVQLVWLGSQAGSHPGLFLALLSSSRLSPLWVVLSRFAWVLVMTASLGGLIRIALQSADRGDRILAWAGFVFCAAWIWFFERPVTEHLASRSIPSAQAATRAGRFPNILLLAVDSLRPDKIDEKKSPALARLCRESIYFPNTLVTLPRTAPSWAAMLTSLPPLGNGVETMFPTAARSRLANIAMPAHLGSLGYATIVSSEYAGEFFGRVLLGFEGKAVPRVELEQMLGQGFLARQPAALALAGELYSTSASFRRILPAPLPELMRGLVSFSHPYVVGADFLERRDPSRPWFAVLFYSQPHFPYTSSRPYYDLQGVSGADSSLRFGKDATRGEVKTDADRAQVDALYRSALAETDDAVGDLLSRLESSGELEDTIVILTADHGEGLYECPDCVGHGDNLRGMMTLRVPLAIRLPKRRFPARRTTIVTHVSQLDVYPTVLELLDAPRPPVQEGVALLGRTELPAAARGRIFFAETGEWLWPTAAVPPRIDYPPITALAAIEHGRIVIEERYLPVIRAAKHRAAILPPFKLVYDRRRGGEWSLYDTRRDPWDEHDIAARARGGRAASRGAGPLGAQVLAHAGLRETTFRTRPAPPPRSITDARAARVRRRVPGGGCFAPPTAGSAAADVRSDHSRARTPSASSYVAVGTDKHELFAKRGVLGSREVCDLHPAGVSSRIGARHEPRGGGNPGGPFRATLEVHAGSVVLQRTIEGGSAPFERGSTLLGRE